MFEKIQFIDILQDFAMNILQYNNLFTGILLIYYFPIILNSGSIKLFQIIKIHIMNTVINTEQKIFSQTAAGKTG